MVQKKSVGGHQEKHPLAGKKWIIKKWKKLRDWMDETWDIREKQYVVEEKNISNG